MRISDWSSDVCSSDLAGGYRGTFAPRARRPRRARQVGATCEIGRKASFPRNGLSGRVRRGGLVEHRGFRLALGHHRRDTQVAGDIDHGARHVEEVVDAQDQADAFGRRSEEHTSELQSLMRISYAVFCLKKKTKR